MWPLIDNALLQAIGYLVLLLILLRSGVAAWQFWRKLLGRQRDLVDAINRVLPQTQCGQCSYEGCLPYARAIARGTPINQCPPGGHAVISRLAVLLNEPVLPLNPAHGEEAPARIAFIREQDCIGCTKCIKACPVDAILGGPKLMHTVIASECTGCDLCVAPCPVDCIDMLPAPVRSVWRWQLPGSVLPTESNDRQQS